MPPESSARFRGNPPKSAGFDLKSVGSPDRRRSRPPQKPLVDLKICRGFLIFRRASRRSCPLCVRMKPCVFVSRGVNLTDMRAGATGRSWYMVTALDPRGSRVDRLRRIRPIRVVASKLVGRGEVHAFPVLYLRGQIRTSQSRRAVGIAIRARWSSGAPPEPTARRIIDVTLAVARPVVRTLRCCLSSRILQGSGFCDFLD